MNEPSAFLALAAAIAVFLGSFLFLAGAIGLVRLPDFYTRMCVSTKAASLGIPLMAFGSMLIHFHTGFDIWIEDALIVLFVFLGNPVCAQILVWAAINRKIRSSTATQGLPIEET